MVLMTPEKTMTEALTFLQVIQELDDFNLRCWFFLNTAAGRVSVVSEALQTELLALVNVILIAKSQGISQVISRQIVSFSSKLWNPTPMTILD
jgi:hypothetical protein